ncbi:LacI family transcriptional regulator [Tessaracoccus lapidicaptus]|uniref:LacI family transcriptional regulator n=2 Tax=Propionibacteriaceae TaxID=31957 RepID=A0A1C0AQB7_9ACTN|nr:LacI family DNA-binding transcriptional regulator [Tessaracoccus lapidicaptus]AQX15107.1 LacI family transcriptional regulator [Tessaracoccus sp. T2.5-30]OCL36581.1 LacI family transcriptional regulator [Tessaracoccus lapidicaptus]VEP39314.1 Lactose operon repressor [Tessaracoccus lapidicaptus]
MTSPRGRSTGRPPGMMAVARLAGVSHQTVSRVLNSPEQVRPATRERVEAAMRELGYSRNLAARALITQQTALLGVVWTGAGYVGPSNTVAGIEVAARRAGYATLVAALENPSDDEVAAVFRGFRDRGVEGIAVVAPHEAMARLAREHSTGIPTVMVADMAPGEGYRVVSVDQRLGGRLATEHLIARGCRRIEHISGPLDWFDARERMVGWREALGAADLPVPAVRVGDWSAESGYATAQVLLRDGALPDAVFCGNDATALGLLAGLRDAGVDVPARIRVVGYDDSLGSGYFTPPLTTVAQPFTELGGTCVDVLVAAIHGDEPGRKHLPPRLVVRASS